MRRGAACCGLWLLLSAFAQPAGERYAAAADQVSAPSTQPPEPGEQYPPSLAEQTTENAVDPRERRRGGASEWRLTVDASVTGDTNVTNSTDRETIDIDLGGTMLPVPLDPSLREQSGVGIGFSAALTGRVPVAPGFSAAFDAEGYVVEYGERLADDASILVAAGGEASLGGGATVTLQATGFQRHYAGVSAMHGFGLRGRLQQPIGEGDRIVLFVDARVFDSDYGEDFGGTEAGVYLSYEAVLDPALSGSIGIFARGSWLGDDAYSSRELGLWGGLNHYLSAGLIGGVSAGISRLTFEEPLLLLSPEARRDWRGYGSVYVATRRPVLIGLTPSLTYTYNRTGSSIEFYRADRHRLRFGLSRTF